MSFAGTGVHMKTYFASKLKTEPEWYLIDASGKTLGRLAAKIAVILRGKDKPSYDPSALCGAGVIVINADKIAVTGNKGEGKLYRHYTGYVGGLKSYSFNTLLARNPTEPLRRTVWGMIPHNRLGRRVIKNLKVYAGSEHPHSAQNPKPIEV